MRFWKGETLCKVELARVGRANAFPSGEITLVSKFLSCISTAPNIVCCSGCPKDLIVLLDGCDFVEHGLQYPFRFDEFSFSSLLHKRKGSVFGPIDFCSVLRFLIVRLEPALKFHWMLFTDELGKVNFHFWTCGLCDPIQVIHFLFYF